MPDMPSITIIKKFSYRGQPEEFSNTYHFSGTVPSSAATWNALFTAIVTAEKATVPSSVTFVRGYGYEAGSDHANWVGDLEVAPATPIAGTFSQGTGIDVPGDVAATIRWPTPDYSSRGKRIYCRKYMHGVFATAADADGIYSSQKTALDAFAATMIDGSLPGSAKYCGPQGAVLSTGVTSPYLTTRTLKRRGKRPPTSP